MKELVPRLRTRSNLPPSSRITAAAIRIVLASTVPVPTMLAPTMLERLEVMIGCFPAAVLVADRGEL
ncbi:hypothetical protein [Mesorhizobium sp. NFR06]|uniref:hypothetical protein n=1 Tax=Mesorhizobium sp. NFR06 TaxID=1566290 RepID=UPI001FCEFA91|nr:hypothetical protein [Mesorhizobium sp. NFR06]